MKFDTLIDGHQRKCRVQAKVPEHPSVWPYIYLELSPLYSGFPLHFETGGKSALFSYFCTPNV